MLDTTVNSTMASRSSSAAAQFFEYGAAANPIRPSLTPAINHRRVICVSPDYLRQVGPINTPADLSHGERLAFAMQAAKAGGDRRASSGR
jgi:hypothetical protein